ncbi:Na(+)/H(+) antiporter subunit F1 [Virgibacillus sp. YIM 98842]|uniref:Na(+)/H(+) antiporter subunit F1 n=1 Tax=Virgibacillus sp. YIM 98842 TaxID=2663533 RepID=UPI0013DA8C87|nr:Na(+)/H(+) antiporter subunit F1 [Virgibacillus sp. YIM 98842]
MIEYLVVGGLALYGIAIAVAVIRMIIGPTLPDRVLALDIIGVNLISCIAIISVMLSTTAFLDVILILGILAFISTIAFARYLERGVIIERKRDS